MNGKLLKNGGEIMSKHVVETPKLGKIEYTDDDIIYMVSPLLGFDHINDYLLISSPETVPFVMLQSIDDMDISFILADINLFFKDYSPNFSKRELKVLQVKKVEELKLFGIVVIKDKPQNATINLKAPIAINLEKRLAKQIILDDDRWEIKTPLFKSEKVK
jgi:flagellar assembly factor FliW